MKQFYVSSCKDMFTQYALMLESSNINPNRFQKPIIVKFGSESRIYQFDTKQTELREVILVSSSEEVDANDSQSNSLLESARSEPI